MESTAQNHRNYKQEYQKNWIRERREDVIKNLGPCVFCKSTTNIEIHHIDASEKESHKIWSWRKDRMDAELKKCVPVCKRCHSMLHSWEKQKPIVHGTLNTYQKYKCRCAECRAANAKSCREQRKKYGRKS